MTGEPNEPRAPRPAVDRQRAKASERRTGPEPGSERWPGEATTPVPVLPPWVLQRYDVRVLDPTIAQRIAGSDRRPRPTAYLADSLLLRGMPDGRPEFAGRLELITKVAAGLDLGVEVDEGVTRLTERLRRRPGSGERIADSWTTRLTLRRTDGSRAPVDAWELLQEVRSVAGARTTGLSLNHLLQACPGLTGVGGLWGGVGGLWGGVGGLWGGVGDALTQYGSPGFGGRTPVVWSAPDPRPAGAKDGPVVAVLDTGLGQHPWFRVGDGVVTDLSFSGVRIGVDWAPGQNPEQTGSVRDPLNGLVDSESGHGTFIAGIVRQRCPSATLLAVPVMHADGTLAEHDLLAALNLLLAMHLEKQADPGLADAYALDVISLSMGYYHEDPDDLDSDAPLAQVLSACADAGVAVVAAAGNDATSAPFFPAAFAGDPDWAIPLTSVGALNPEGHSVALFSNNGPWISTHAPGAGVVSTVPVTLSGSQGRSIEVTRDDPTDRATVDPDDYRSGFAVWSGTSFAAPWIAGELAARLAAGQAGSGQGSSGQGSSGQAGSGQGSSGQAGSGQGSSGQGSAVAGSHRRTCEIREQMIADQLAAIRGHGPTDGGGAS